MDNDLKTDRNRQKQTGGMENHPWKLLQGKGTDRQQTKNTWTSQQTKTDRQKHRHTNTHTYGHLNFWSENSAHELLLNLS